MNRDPRIELSQELEAIESEAELFAGAEQVD
jgi:hypothetical protein